VKFLRRKLGVICCGHVFRGERKVLLVDRLAGNDWGFMCGGKDHFGSKDGHFVIVGVLLDSDPSLNEVADLPPGWEAERKEVGAAWIRTRLRFSVAQSSAHARRPQAGVVEVSGRGAGKFWHGADGISLRTVKRIEIARSRLNPADFRVDCRTNPDPTPYDPTRRF